MIGVHTRILVNGVTVEQEVWLEDIIELCILGLAAVGQLGATVDIEATQQHVSDSLDTQAKQAQHL